ncbi:phage portal protein [Fictibacillus sp. 26RED30]|uniref:phage portal protein n=1 Tax=Fictibacillus sp. 26RED30 TaxID=2745877 RepID=UPI0018CE0E4A|nr:phage portal protein [Fictibacillus sp. 26RED30]MBH0159876.1 phage portal protein [Fictibacillus sp. 26RED30]
MNLIKVSSVEQVLNPEFLKVVIENHKTGTLTRLEKLQNYFEGKHAITNRTMTDTNKPNNKVVNPFPSYIVNTTVGYFMGKPVQYASADTSLLESVQDVFKRNDEQYVNAEHSKQSGIKGLSAELLYMDEESQIKFDVLDVNELVLVYDTKIDPSLIAAIRYYSVQDYVSKESVVHVEVYTANEIVMYEQSKKEYVEKDRKEHHFKEVPVVVYWNNGEGIGDFEKLIPLIDEYDKAVSDRANDLEYFADAYLVLKGMNATQPEDVNEMKQNRVMLLDEKGTAEWLVKEIDNESLESFKDRLEKDIHKFSHVPNMSDETFGSNLSGIAIKYKFMGLETLVSQKERLFKQALSKRIRLVVNILNTKGQSFEATELGMLFTRNLPVNKTEEAEFAQKLFGIVSEETLLAQLSFIEDALDEIDKKKQEKENGDYSSIGQV